MAGDAVLVDDGSDGFGEGDARALCRDALFRLHGDNHRECCDGDDDDDRSRHNSPHQHRGPSAFATGFGETGWFAAYLNQLQSLGMKQPIASVFVRATGRPASTASSALVRSCAVTT